MKSIRYHINGSAGKTRVQKHDYRFIPCLQTERRRSRLLSVYTLPNDRNGSGNVIDATRFILLRFSNVLNVCVDYHSMLGVCVDFIASTNFYLSYLKYNTLTTVLFNNNRLSFNNRCICIVKNCVVNTICRRRRRRCCLRSVYIPLR